MSRTSGLSSGAAPKAIAEANGSSRLDRALSIGLVVAALAQFALFSAVLGRTMILEPVGDMFDWVDSYLRVHGTRELLAYLWAPHIEHHYVLVKILTALDISVFRGNEVVFVLASTASLLGVAALVVLELRRDRSLAASPGALAVMGSMLILTATAALDCAIPIDSPYPMALLFMVVALVLFDGETERTRLTDAKRVLALCAAVVAALASGVALVVWPALLWSAWRGGAARGWLFGIVILGAGYGWVYTREVPAIGVGVGIPEHVFDASHLSKMFEYFLTYLALPLSRVRSLAIPMRAAGGMLLCSSAIAIVRAAVSPRPPTRLQRIAIGLIIASLASGLLAAAGRVDIDAEVKVPVRYAVLVAPLQIGLLALAWPWLGQRAALLHRESVMLAVTVAAGWALVACQVVVGLAAVTVSDEIKTTVERHGGSEPASGELQVGFPDPAVVRRVQSALRAAR